MICFIGTLLLRFNTPEESLTECDEHMVFLIWTDSSGYSDNTKSHLAASFLINSKVLQRN